MYDKKNRQKPLEIKYAWNSLILCRCLSVDDLLCIIMCIRMPITLLTNPSAKHARYGGGGGRPMPTELKRSPLSTGVSLGGLAKYERFFAAAAAAAVGDLQLRQ